MVQFFHPEAEIYFPDPANRNQLGKTTHLGIGAHQDDLEMLAIHGILTAYDHPDAAFTGVTVTDGRGAPLSGPYADLSDDELWKVRVEEQKAAARIGKYLAQIFLNYSSKEIKSSLLQNAVTDLKQILQETQPEVIYTHNLADKHDTHVAVTLAVIEACRETAALLQNLKVYGCEIWRDLDWLSDDRKVALDVSGQPALQEKLMEVFQSQIVGGKRYDRAAISRRIANATFYESHAIDQADRMIFAMDLTPLVQQPKISIPKYMDQIIHELAVDVRNRLEKLGK